MSTQLVLLLCKLRTLLRWWYQAFCAIRQYPVDLLLLGIPSIELEPLLNARSLSVTEPR